MTFATNERLYDLMSAKIPHAHFINMNMGFIHKDAKPDDDYFSWIQSKDKNQPHAANLIKELIAGIPLTGLDVLDVGCGRGGACSLYARYHRPNSVVGLDRNRMQVEFCQQTHVEPALSFVQGLAENLPFANGTLDVVTNMESSHCYADLNRFFSEVYRVLRPGGYFCYTDMIFTPALQLQNATGENSFHFGGIEYPVQTNNHSENLEKAGFHIESERNITPEVMISMNMNKFKNSAYINSLRDQALANDDVVDGMTALHDVAIYEAFKVGTMSYKMYRLRKPQEQA